MKSQLLPESVILVKAVGCVHLLYNISWKSHQLAAGQLLHGQAVRPVHHITNHTCRVTLLQLSQTGRRAGSSLRDNASSLPITYDFILKFILFLETCPVLFVFRRKSAKFLKLFFIFPQEEPSQPIFRQLVT
jgi:hypothetical protein